MRFTQGTSQRLQVLQVVLQLKRLLTTFIVRVSTILALQLHTDHYLGSALRNWTNGNWANGTKNPAGAPSLYGSNFQIITWAQQQAGYLDVNGNQPNKSLESALTEADARLGDFLNFLQSTGKLNSTLVMIGSKQGQGPINPKTLKVSNPDFMQDDTGVPVQFFVGEDGGIVSHHPSARIFVHNEGPLLTVSKAMAREILRWPKSQEQALGECQPGPFVRARWR
jgi:hypothetical protein